jgi:nitrilase
MGDTYAKIRVAAIQAAPVFLNREATVEKACRLIKEAAANGASVIGFPEGFIPGHPLWYHFHPATSSHSMKLATELFKNSVEIPSPATDALCQAARE